MLGVCFSHQRDIDILPITEFNLAIDSPPGEYVPGIDNIFRSLNMTRGRDSHYRSHGKLEMHFRRRLRAVCKPNFLDNRFINSQSVDYLPGSTMLKIAVNHGFNDTVGLLLAAGANPNLATAYGETPLHSATRGSGVLVLKMLLADPRTEQLSDAEGITPLYIAVVMRDIEKVQLLLRHHPGKSLEIDIGGKTPLQYARHHKSIKITELLKKYSVKHGIPS